MTLRPWHRIALFGFCLLVVLGGIGWISVTVLQLDAREGTARRRAHLEESVRLALWRMDTMLAPILAREWARSPDEYAALPHAVGETIDDGTIARMVTDAEVAQAQERAAQLKKGLVSIEAQQEAMNVVEYSQRARAVMQNSAPPAALVGSFEPMVARWIDGELYLVRRGWDVKQGVKLDWRALRERLLTEVRDLLPEASLEPAAPGADPAGERRLASLPVVLVPGKAAGAPVASASPVTSILGVAWTAVLLAAIAVAWLLIGTLSLGERRSAFVSAVTHELRTPLTTLTTYTEMLADGMVKDEEKRRSYLETLRREAVRLGHLVENVLSYARIEQGRSGDRTQPAPLGEAIERARPRLEERAAQAGMTLVVEDGAKGVSVRLDPVAFEQVLFNLVDNACKYAAGADDKRIHVIASEEGEVWVRDHGPGLDEAARKRLFQPFSRSAARAAGRSPGVGLGLALCRRLARAMGGDLGLERVSDGGASFHLTLERVERTNRV